MKWIYLFLYGLMLLHTTMTQAGILAASTRVIYPEALKQQTLMLANVNDYPIVAQTWVDDGQGNPDQAQAPFVVLPAVFKMKPKGIQALRIVHNGDKMPQDRESVFWLNLYEIPGKTSEQTKPLEQGQARLDLALNTQLKIFYRPKNLPKMDLKQVAEQLHFSVHQQQEQWVLICQNPTPYHVSFAGIILLQDKQRVIVPHDMDMMTPALGQKVYVLPNDFKMTQPDKIEFSLIGDNGRFYQGSFNQRTGKVELDFN